MPKDLALLKIDPPFQESDKVKPIKINDVYEDLYGKEVLISGWGMTTTEYPYQLQALNITINYNGYDGFISMLNSKGEGGCFGDSGGINTVKYRENIILHISFILLNQIIIIEIIISSNLCRTCCP